MDILLGSSILLLLCIALLALAIWFRTSKENQAFLNVMSRLMEVEKISRECQTLVNSHNTTVSGHSLKVKAMEEKVSEIDNFQDHLKLLRDDHHRLVNLVAWKKMVVRFEEKPKRKERARTC